MLAAWHQSSGDPVATGSERAIYPSRESRGIVKREDSANANTEAVQSDSLPSASSEPSPGNLLPNHGQTGAMQRPGTTNARQVRTRSDDLAVVRAAHRITADDEGSAPPPAEMSEEAKRLFDAIDNNSDGYITAEELSCRLSDAGWLDNQIMQLFLELDQDLDGKISGAEFERAWKLNLFCQKPNSLAGTGGATQQLMERLRDKVYQKWRSLRDAFRSIYVSNNNHNPSSHMLAAKPNREGWLQVDRRGS